MHRINNKTPYKPYSTVFTKRLENKQAYRCKPAALC